MTCSISSFGELSREVFFNPWASASYACGQKLLRPLEIDLNLTMRLIQPLSPGFREQWATYSRELVHRVVELASLILSLPVVVVLSPLGFSLSYLGNLYRRELVILRPTLEGSIRSDLPNELRMTTFNVAYMPRFITTVNCIRPTHERRVEVERVLADRDDDIILIQEMFEEAATVETVQTLRDQYPYRVVMVGSQTVGLNSGLAVFSKYPLEDVKFWRYSHASSCDSFANKGLLAATLRLSQDKVAFLFNTHLNAGHSDSEGADFRRLQIQQMRPLVQRYIENSPLQEQNIGVFFGGDFNIAPDIGVSDRHQSREWIEHQAFFRGEFTEGYEGDGPSIPGEEGPLGTFFHIDHRGEGTGWNRTTVDQWEVERECLDHVLYRSNQTSDCYYKSQNYIRDRMEGSSDHLAVRARFNLFRTPTAQDRSPQDARDGTCLDVLVAE